MGVILRVRLKGVNKVSSAYLCEIVFGACDIK